MRDIGSTPTDRRQIAAAIVGNALEWYDFTIYGYLAVTIARLFFPPQNSLAPLATTLALFGGAFFVRPVGGIIMGHFADLYGRKSVLIAMIALMTLGTLMIAAAPSYADIGRLAPVTILAARLIQGLSVGGEFGSATTLLIEVAPPGKRGLYGGWQFAGQGAAILLAGIVGSGLTQALTPEQIDAWGWRVPFIIGLIIGPIGIYLRWRLQETREFQRVRATRRGRALPIVQVMAEMKGRVLAGFALMAGGTAAVYVLFVFMPTYAMQVLRLDMTTAFAAPLAAGAAVTIFCPIGGYASDLFGRRRVMLVAVLLLLAALYPCFQWLHAAPSLGRLVTVEILFGVVISAYAGPLGTAIAELFPTASRATATSVSYNLGVALFGAMAPLIVAWLIAVTGSALAPAEYVMAALLISLATLIVLPAPDRGS
jgi:MFS transporter, MHS family, proline/betaine transporter